MAMNRSIHMINLSPPTRAMVRWSLPALGVFLASGPSLHADYASLVLSDNPKAYYRFNDDTTRSVINSNSGSVGAAGNLTNTLNVKSIPGAIAGSGNRARFYDTGTSYGMIPFNAAVNPDNTQPFTIEAWLYPASDQIDTGMCPINNRVSSGFPDRTGWVFFQRAPSLDYNGRSGYEGVGWNCRMYRGSGGSSGLDVTSQVPFEVGKWAHVVVVYDPVQITNSTLTMYINGVPANTNIWTGGPSGSDPGYAANPPVTGAALSLGAYNNTSGTGNNPCFGGVDEFAFYATKLTAAQILAHYQSGTNANRSTPYEALIQSANPVVYLRLDERAPGEDTVINYGDLRSAGNGTNTAEVRHPAAGAVAADPKSGAAAYHTRNGNAHTLLPYTAENNPDSSVPFTFEAWLRPMRDQQGGQCPVGNRYQNSGDRTGWVIFQRFPNTSYAGVPGINNEGHGWNFRMYSGSGTGGQSILTDYDYTVGKWQHLVVTWEPQTDMGMVGSFGLHHQYQGILTAYVDGNAVASNTAALYSANINPTDNGSAPADLGIGSYNSVSSPSFGNPFEGDVGEVALYNGYVLTPDQILSHYMAGTNANYGTNYESLVLMAPYDGAGTQRLGPKTYLRFNDPAIYSTANSGSGGIAADGNLTLTTNIAAGPRSPAYPGFEASNTAVPLDGAKAWASFNNPAGLNTSGQITLEAWIKPDAVQGATARIISHGPPTVCDYLIQPPDGAVTNSMQVFLKIDGTAGTYEVGATIVNYTNDVEFGSNTYAASASIPVGDLGGANWIHLVGTYDGANWRLYRNGTLLATQASAVGALVVNDGDWAVGSTGNGWADAYAGGVDEVAIYGTALTAAQIQGHYAAGTQVPRISIAKSGGNLTLTWPYGKLFQADNVNGPWTLVPGNPTSPYTTSAGTSRKFYRF